MSGESTRDRTIEHLLRSSLGGGAPLPPGPACLEAETLAAWVDGSLSGGARAAAESHAADCARCQAMLAALVRTAPIPPVAEPWWRQALGARWLVPLAATATALAIWVAVPREEYTAPATPDSVSARQEATTETFAPTPAETTPAGEPRANQELAADRPAAPPAAPDRSSAVGDTAARESLAGRGVETAPLEETRQFAQQDADQLDRRDAAAKATPAQPPPAGAVASGMVGGVAERAEPVPQAAATAAAPPAAATPVAGLRARQEAVAVAPWRAETASPDGPFRWRVGVNGTAQVSVDRGTTWEATTTGVPADLLAASSPGGTTCWVVGRSGTVLLTTDGRRWQRLSFPVTVDVTAVQATDARRALVTTQDGRRFTTLDGGATWN